MPDESLDIPIHPYALIFPVLSAESDDYKELANNIRENGQREPAILFKGMLLDGNTRYRISKQYKLPFHTKEFEGTDDEAFELVLSLNLHRRHLHEYSRAMSAARAGKALGKIGTKGEVKTETKDYLHKTFNVSQRTIEHAFTVLNFADEDLINNIDNGRFSVSFAAKVTKLPTKHRQEIIYGEVSAARQKVKILERQDRELKFASKIRSDVNKAASNGETKLYGVIYIDPPWSFDTYSEAGKDRSPDQHYQTMSLDDIRALTMPAAENCVLFLWSTVAHLNNAIETLEGWGFDYKSAYAWHKMNPGTGYWSANELELLLVGTKGTIPAPSSDLRMKQVTHCKQGEHSAKPETFGMGISRMFPNTPSVEMFARHIANRGNHWTYMGNEIDGQDLRELMRNDNIPIQQTNGNGNGTKTKRARKGKTNGTPTPPGATSETETESQEEGVSP